MDIILFGVLGALGACLIALTWSAKLIARIQDPLLLGLELLALAWMLISASGISVILESQKVESYFVPLLEQKAIDVKLLKKIIECESSFRAHIKSKTGDHGYFQINEKIWNEKAKKLGLDLKEPVDNLLFGVWLFQIYGTRPWIASIKCWEGNKNER